MARLHFGDVSFEADLIAFDKDGTLIDFDRMWGQFTEAWVARITGTGAANDLAADLHRTFGYDPTAHRTLPESPLAIASTVQLQTIAAATLYRHGIPWTQAEERVRQAFGQATAELDPAKLVFPAGDVSGLFVELRRAAVQVAVVTSDDRRPTEVVLRELGIDRLVGAVVCGDDGLPIKPAPDMLLAACSLLSVKPARSAVVGDTMGDLLMAERAGAGLRVAVLAGAGDPDELRAHADVVIESIDQIVVANP